MDSLANDFRTALTLKVPTTSISEHFSDSEGVGSDSSSVGDCFASQGGSEGRQHGVPKISVGFFDSDQTATSLSSRSSNKVSIGMSKTVLSTSSLSDISSKQGKGKLLQEQEPTIVVETQEEEEKKERDIYQT